MFANYKCQLACWAILLASPVVLADAPPEFLIGAYRFRQELHASRVNLARRREQRVMLGISLALAVIILGVILGYFLFA